MSVRPEVFRRVLLAKSLLLSGSSVGSQTANDHVIALHVLNAHDAADTDLIKRVRISQNSSVLGSIFGEEKAQFVNREDVEIVCVPRPPFRNRLPEIPFQDDPPIL